MTRINPPNHGDAHRPPGTLGPTDPGGPDQIPGISSDGISFNKDNEGGWLLVKANAVQTDLGPSFGHAFGGIVLIDDSGDGTGSGLWLSSMSSDINITAAVSLNIIAAAMAATLGNVGIITAAAGDNLEIQLPTSGKLVVRDNSGNAIFEVRDDASVHIKTGTSIVADL